MPLRPGPSPMASEEYGRPDKVLSIVIGVLGEGYIILEGGAFAPLAPGPRRMGRFDRCGAFRLPYLSTLSTSKAEKESEPARAPPRQAGPRAETPNERSKTMAGGKKIKANPKKGVLYEGLVQPLEKSHGGTVKMIGGIRNAKNKMPKPIRDRFPDF